MSATGVCVIAGAHLSATPTRFRCEDSSFAAGEICAGGQDFDSQDRVARAWDE
jgi:hypothetical protein